jgi:hypothetical protein
MYVIINMDTYRLWVEGSLRARAWNLNFEFAYNVTNNNK